MSGPIVRSAPSKKFTANWDAAFGSKTADAQDTPPAKAGAKKVVAKQPAAKPAPARQPVAKQPVAKKSAAKKKS